MTKQVGMGMGKEKYLAAIQTIEATADSDSESFLSAIQPFEATAEFCLVLG